MKSITIIDAYAPTLDKQNLLIECINSCRRLGTDIMVVSHHALPENILGMIDYFVYDSNNTFNSFSAFAWKTVGNLTVNIRITKSHNYPIVRSMRNAFGLANALGYEFFFFTEFDHNFSESDTQRLTELKTNMLDQSKDFLFFRPRNAVWQVDGVSIYDVYYETSFFAGRVAPFTKIFDGYFPSELEDFNSAFGQMGKDTPNCLEHLFYNAYHRFITKSVVIEQYVKEYFTDSRINVSSAENTKSLILRANDGRDFLYITNDNTDEYLFKVYMNGDEQSQVTLTSRTVSEGFTIIPLPHNCDIKVLVYQDDTLVSTHLLEYKLEEAHKFVDNGSIVFG